MNNFGDHSMKRFIFTLVLFISMIFIADNASAQSCTAPWVANDITFTLPNGCTGSVAYCCFDDLNNNTMDVQIRRIRFEDLLGCYGGTIPNMDLAFWEAIHLAIVNACSTNIPPCGSGQNYTLHITHEACAHAVYFPPNGMNVAWLYFVESCQKFGVGCEYVYDVCFDPNTGQYVLNLLPNYPIQNNSAACPDLFNQINQQIQNDPKKQFESDCTSLPCK